MASASLFLPGFNRSFAKTPFATEAKACAEIAGISLFQSLVRENPFCNLTNGASRRTPMLVSIARSRKPLLQPDTAEAFHCIPIVSIARSRKPLLQRLLECD